MRFYARSCIVVLLIIISIHAWRRTQREPTIDYSNCDPAQRHDIDLLLKQSTDSWTSLLSKETRDVHAGAAAYRARRGRHPPPGFKEWYSYARQKNAVIIEDFFDQVYRDIEPFWGLKPSDIQSSLFEWPEIVKIRRGQVVNVPNGYVRTKEWVSMIKQIAAYLPDLDIAINHLDEARVIAPWQTVNETISAAQAHREKTRSLPVSSFRGEIEAASRQAGKTAVPAERAVWQHNKQQHQAALRESCPPGTPLSRLSMPFNGDEVSSISHTRMQFVQNVTAAKWICQSTELTRMHGALEELATYDFTTTLMPIFTGSKLPSYQDIVIPEPSYYSDDRKFTGKDFWGDRSNWYAWSNKRHGLVWRGTATGGGQHDSNFRFFHRHRFISHMNASETDAALTGERNAIATRLGSTLSELQQWLASTIDAAFTKLYCDDRHDAIFCPDMGSHYRIAKPIKMGSQYQWKYLPDVDGNSVSERFRAFLLSNSAPVKASIFDDWHDYRLSAWQHYIPLSISFDDLYFIMAYFLGYGETCAHDDVGKRIADNGREWSKKVLRKEDMIIYMHRVLLEYARVVHDDRDRLGWVDDLKIR